MIVYELSWVLVQKKFMKKNNLSPNPVDILFDNIFFETDIAQCMMF